MNGANKFLKVGTFFLIGILLMSFVPASYSRSSPQYARPGSSSSYNYGANVELNPQARFGEDMCSAGQDFVLQIPPGGCEPAIVRSDMLEEQNMPVFCQIAATKINPLIDVNAIDYISFKGEYPEGVSGIGFHPARANIKSSRGQLSNSPVLENIGYAVIVLDQNKNESSMPDYVEGSVTAHLKYDIENAFGIGRATYYLPELSDVEWENNYQQYGFWNGKGFLRTENVDENGATISVYQDEFNKIGTVHLEEGETSRQIQLPGFYCIAGLNLKLDDMSNPGTRARLNIDGSITEVGENERFLDDKCQIRGAPDKNGLSEKISVSCRTDEGTKNFDLAISPSVSLSVKGEVFKDYSIGDILASVNSDGKVRNVFLGYIGENSEGKKYIIPVVSTETTKEGFLNSLDYDLANKWGDMSVILDGSLLDILKAGGLNVANIGAAIGAGTDLGKPIIEKNTSNAEFLFDSVGKQASGAGLVGMSAAALTLFFGGGIVLIPLAALVFSFAGYGVFQKILARPSIAPISIEFKSLTSPGDAQFKSNNFRLNFESAIKDYKAVANNFPNVPGSKIKKGDLGYQSAGEEALIKAITLSAETEQIATMRTLCEDFKQLYPDSNFYPTGSCDNPSYLIESSESTSRLVSVNGEVKAIKFEGISQPTFEEFGAVVGIRGASGGTYDDPHRELTKGQRVYLSEKEFFELDRIEDDYIIVKASLAPKGNWEKWVAGQATSYRIELGKYQILGGHENYEVKLNKINLEKQAKISVLPKIENAGTEANFSFKIGIEKRAIQLSPKQTEDRIKKLEEYSKQWKEISENLGNVIKGFKGACLGIGAMLTVKNFFGGLDGTAIARQETMQGENGWIKLCDTAAKTDLLFDKSVSYVNVDDCLNQNNEAVEKDVKIIKGVMASQGSEERKVTEDTIRDGASLENVGFRLEGSLDENTRSALTAQGYKDGLVTMSQARDLDRLHELANNPDVSDNIRNMSAAKRDSILESISKNAQSYKAVLEADKRDKENNLDGMLTNNYDDKRRVVGRYNGFIMPAGKLGEIPGHSKITKVVLDEQVYYVSLEEGGLGDNLKIKDIYDLNGIKADDVFSSKIRGRYTSFKLYDASSYQNPMNSIDKRIRYFETAPYQGLPAVVPFDTSHGWYVRVKQTLGASGNIRAYDDSGRAGSFYLCNVMKDKRIASDIGSGDDECMKFNPATGQVYGTFPGLDEKDTSAKVNCAIDAIDSAEKASSKKGGTSVSLRYCGKSETIAVGEPASNTPEFQCQNFMSPKDCWILFNACDPVICPTSRCDFGGTYPVKNVIQSGIIGSIALCLPNVKEKIVVPVCLTGIKAGIDGLLSMLDSYSGCLQNSLDTGETTGVCDEIHSIYLCEFLWKQSLPLFKLGVPKLLEFATGQGMRGGGEYLNVQSAWENADNSINFFTQQYGANSFTAFKARSTEEVGSEVCKVSISARYPVSGIFFDNLLEPDSPAQFHGWFSEDTLTTATVPPTSQYHVYYHIFAGNDQGVSYKVYLSGADEGGFYEDVGTITIDSGFIAKGETADEKKDFPAPANYKQLCISVNNQVECGFGKVSTSFAVDYAEEMYSSDQSSKKATTTSECEAGSESAWELLNPNVQQGVENTINPDLYNHGIIRVCSTSSPGKATDVKVGGSEARWLDVGYCDNENVRCWLDTESVKNTVKDLDLESQAIKEAINSHMAQLDAMDDVVTEKKFINELQPEIEKQVVMDGNIMAKASAIKVVNFITLDLISKTLMNENKVWLYLKRADAFYSLAKHEHDRIKIEEASNPVTPDDGGVVEEKKGLLKRAKDKLERLLYFGNTRGEDVSRLILHYTGGSTADSAIETLIGRNLSVHYISERDGSLTKLVPEEKVAYHASGANENSIGIEIVNLGWQCGDASFKSSCEDVGQGASSSSLVAYNNWDSAVGCKNEFDGKVWQKYPSEQIDSIAKLSACILKRNPKILLNRDHIIGHDEVKVGKECRKQDPGPAFPWEEFMQKVKSYENIDCDTMDITVYELEEDSESVGLVISVLTGEEIIDFDFLGISIQVGNDYKGNFECVVDKLNSDSVCKNSYVLKSDYIVGFEDRQSVSGGISKHAYGSAIDINQKDNPYCKKDGESCCGEVGCCKQDSATNSRNTGECSPSDCSANWEEICKQAIVDGKGNPPLVTDIPSCWVKKFTDCGFDWGGDWSSIKDPQHFEVVNKINSQEKKEVKKEIVFSPDSPVFEFKDGTEAKNLYYQYQNEKWVWTFVNGQSPSWKDGVGDFKEELNIQDRDRINNIVGKNYDDGIKFLMEDTIEKGKKWWSFPDLSTGTLDETVIFLYSGFFRIGESNNKIYFKFYNGRWVWALKNKETYLTNWDQDKDFEKNSYNPKYRSLVESLVGKTEIEGAKILFDLKEDGGFYSTTTTTSTTTTSSSSTTTTTPSSSTTTTIPPESSSSCDIVSEGTPMKISTYDPCLSKEEIRKILEIIPGNPLIGLEEIIYKKGLTFSVDSSVVLAFFKELSKFGIESICNNLSQTKNPGGIYFIGESEYFSEGDYYESPCNYEKDLSEHIKYIKYSSWEEGITEMVYGFYSEQNSKTVEGLSEKYCSYLGCDKEEFVKNIRADVNKWRAKDFI